MDTRHDEQEAAPSGGPQDRRSKTSLGWGPGALAGVALVAVIAAVVWAIVPSDGPSRQEVTRAPGTASSASDAEEENDRVYLWDPATGDGWVVLSTPMEPRNPEYSPDGERLVFDGSQDFNEPSQIYLRQADGVERRLTDLPGGASDPTWSPDGRKIAFVASPRDEYDPDIYVMGADGTHLRRLAGTKAPDGHPDWSPDGSSIAFHTRYGRYDLRSSIWVASVRTQALTRLTPRDVFGAMDPTWSPDGSWIAYSWYGGDTLNGRPYSAELWRMRSDGTDERRITQPDGHSVNENPSWSPDGRLIVFASHTWDGGYPRMVVVNPRTGHERPILSRAGAAVYSWEGSVEGGNAPSWSREGILIALASGSPVPAPRPAPPAFQFVPGIDAPGIDATITLRPGSGCVLDRDRPLPPGRLKLELVNDSHLEGGFRVIRLNPTQTIGRLRAHPPSFRFGHDKTEFLDPSTARVSSSTRRIGSGQWAVICYRDRIPAPNGFYIVSVGIAGPIEIER